MTPLEELKLKILEKEKELEILKKMPVNKNRYVYEFTPQALARIKSVQKETFLNWDFQSQEQDFEEFWRMFLNDEIHNIVDFAKLKGVERHKRKNAT